MLPSFDAFSLRCRDGALELLDQQLLPDVEKWLDASQPEQTWQHIKSLSVRGAPMIGVAAAMCLAHYALHGAALVACVLALR